jgi:hypothetical protein
MPLTAKKMANGGKRCRPNADKRCQRSSIELKNFNRDNALSSGLKPAS